MNTRLIEDLASRIVDLPDRAIVAVDGIDGAGKSTFSDLLADRTKNYGRPVIRATVDNFHNPARFRYARGRNDPTGFFLDSYDYVRLRKYLIEPFRNGKTEILTSVFDHQTDKPNPVKQRVPPKALLVFDGIFLHRQELLDEWDFSIFISVPFSVSYARMAQRDGSNPDPLAPENTRYYEGQLRYLREAKPEKSARLVVTEW
ncbi:hypothetical protein ABEB22_14245 (plasmid) [Thioclava sp. 'Guangxiensis']|uniref:hypothetical protein n=1 Tax=Thioclava sp. 'Guangxiensis' TaxID=3149044 RepID=UPI0032C42352